MAANQPARQFKIPQTNFCFDLAAQDCQHDPFRGWINFLSQQSFVRYAMCRNVDLNEQSIRAFYLSAENRSTNSPDDSYQKLMFRVRQREYIVTEDDVNAILKFSVGNTDFAPQPTEAELVAFFQFINYQNLPQNMKELSQKHLPNQWRFFFNVISHVFAPKTHGFHGITPFLQKIGYAVAYNHRINFGKLILQELLKKMGTVETRSLVNKDVVCYYPRFIQLILDAILSDDTDQLNFAAGSRLTSCAKMKYLFITRMVSNERYPGVVSPLTPFMQARFNQPPLAENAFINEQGEVVIMEQEQPQQVEEQMDQAEQPQEFEAELREIPMEQGILESDPFPEQLIEYQPPVALGQDQGIENPQSLTPIIEPNTQTNTLSTTQPLKRKEPMSNEGNEGVTADPVVNKDVLVREPTTLPPQKKRSIQTEATINSPVSSRKDTVVEKAQKQSLDSSSQQGASIETRLAARASLTVGESPPQTQPENIFIAQSKVAHTKAVLTETTSSPTILRSGPLVGGSLMNQVPSQASREGFDPNANPSGSLSNSPEGTSLDPAGNGSDVGADRQLVDNDSDLPDESNKEMLLQALERDLGPLLSNRPSSTLPEATSLDPIWDGSSHEGDQQLVLNEEEDLRNPIAPPVTSLRTATVIFSAGTAGITSSQGMSDTSTERLSDSQTLRPSENLERSETPTELVCKETTQPQISPEFVSRVEFNALQQQVISLTVENVELRQENKELDKQIQLTRLIQKKLIDDHQNAIMRLQNEMNEFKALTMKDNTTEGEKERQEKAGCQTVQTGDDKRKRVMVAESSQPQREQNPDLEEGELNEPYAHDFVENVPRGEDVIEEDEFVDENAYDNDCVVYGESIVTDFEQAKKEQEVKAERKKLRIKRAKEREARQARMADIATKEGPKWDRARKSLELPELGLKSNNDKGVVKVFEDIRRDYPDIHLRYEILCELITSISVSTLEDGWRLFINFYQNGSQMISSKLLPKLDLTDLYVMKNKVISVGENANELIRDKIEDMIESIGVEVYSKPPVVKYYKNRSLHNMTLTDESLDRSRLEYIEYVEGQLRSKGERTTEKLEAAELLFAYRLNRKALWGDDLNQVTRYNPLSSSSTLEEVQCTPIVVREEPLSVLVKIKVSAELKVVKVSKLRLYPSEEIQKVLLNIKRSTNRKDKIALRSVQEIYRLKDEEERAMDTQRVKNNPKRITVSLTTKQFSLEFKGVKTINHIPTLETLLQRLEVPDPENALETEARDLVKARLKLLEAQRAAKAEASRKEKDAAEKKKKKQTKRK